MKSFAGKHILVLGLGLHGGAIGNIKYLASQKAHIIVSDTKTKEQLQSSIDQLSDIPNIDYVFGPQDNIDLSFIDIVLRNPAVPRHAPILEQAQARNIPILMDSSIFFEQAGKDRIIGITGSKGKTTTSHAIYHVLHNFIPETAAVGIDGVSPLEALMFLPPNFVAPDQPSPPPSPQLGRGESSFIVFELSSWRLEALQERRLSPHIAVCTSIYKDHLNTYDSYEEYIDVKKQIIRDQTEHDIAILNYDDEIIRTWEQDVRGKLYWYSQNELPEGKHGIWVGEENIVCHAGLDPASGSGAGITTADIPYTSLHESRNKLPAVLIALLHGSSFEKIKTALQTIPPLQHRLQIVRTINSVAYINDSAATMPDAAIAALQSLQGKPVVMILGGSDKALDFEHLAHQISISNIRHLIWLPGTATDRMQKTILPRTTATSHTVSTMQEAVTLARNLAQAGDTVLLSPGATSFGLFLHEFDRGNAFIDAVNKQ